MTDTMLANTLEDSVMATAFVGRSCLIVTLVMILTASVSAQNAKPLTEVQREQFNKDLQQLNADLAAIQQQPHAVDARVFAKGLHWALKYDKEFSTGDVALLEKAVQRGRERCTAVAQGQAPWLSQRGKVALGYVSQVDGSVQPYGLAVPQHYSPDKPMRLDVVLHGSTRPVGMSELRFMNRFDGDASGAIVPTHDYIELHPLGRVENCYRWAGETDVFEAIQDVCRRFKIDRHRIVLRGMSMGASGTWHLGLKHPDRFAALGPYCGYVDTHRFSETPIRNFVKVGPLPEHQELALHMLDSVDYAANAGVVPAIACMGEKDVFFQAHVLMGEAMKREGLTMVNLISPGTGHVIDPKTHAQQLQLIERHLAGRPVEGAGPEPHPSELRFVTWTLKYSRCHWVELLGLKQHYARSEFKARLHNDRLEISSVENVTRFALDRGKLPSATSAPTEIVIGTQRLSWPQQSRAEFERTENGWQLVTTSADSHRAKRPGLQGPIDDAFASPFLCVRGTGTPWNPTAQRYGDFALQRFADEWHHYFRGDLPIKNDVDVTEADIEQRHLILFGDPGSNVLLAKALPELPLKWTTRSFQLQGHEYDSAEHVPALIAPNPLTKNSSKYVVLNSGHTFRESELSKLNYLLFPRWGDWAALKLSNNAAEETVIRAGYFNEDWK